MAFLLQKESSLFLFIALLLIDSFKIHDQTPLVFYSNTLTRLGEETISAELGFVVSVTCLDAVWLFDGGYE